MNKTTSKFQYRYEDAVGQYFGSGWAFFLPYLFLYLFFWATGWRIQTLTTIFYFLHSLHAIGLIYFICLKFRTIDWRSALFWLALASLFFNVGAYLEFPSDPWEHLWRIFQWQHLETIAEASANHKFAYFFGYSLMGWTEPANHLIAADLYFTFWSLLLALQFYRLALKCSLREPWARLAVIGTILLMGNSSFGFYRYYGIASTMLSTIAFLAGLNATIEYIRSKKISWVIPVGFSLLLSFCNHPQGILLYLAVSMGIIFSLLVDKLGWKQFLFKIVSTLLISAILFRLLLETPWLEDIRKTLGPILTSGDWLYPWGGFKLFSFDPQINNGPGRFLQITGGLGCLNLIVAAFCLRKRQLIGWITISPVLLLLYPPFAITFAYLLAKHDTIIVFQRVLLATPQGFCLIILIQNAYRKGKIRELLESQNCTPLATLAIIILSSNPAPHFFGRFQQAFLHTPPQLSLSSLAETSQYLFSNLALEKDQYILSDTATQFVVSAHLGLKDRGSRLAVQDLAARIDSLGGAEGISQSPEIAGVLALARQPEVDPVGSLLGKASGHWHPQTVRSNLSFIPSLEHELHSLVEHGWKKTAVPPWYNFYSRPREIP
jgi:hypothetical protein